MVLVLGLLAPLYAGWMLMQGSNPGELYLWSLASLALSAWAGVRMSLLRYFLEWNGGRTVTVHLPDTRSTEDRIAAKEFAHSQLNPLELIWFPLEYPGKTVIEYHVRSQKLPWLVFLAGGNKKRSRDLLKSLGEQLLVGVADKSESKPAKNVPKKFQLSDAEKKNASRNGKQLLAHQAGNTSVRALARTRLDSAIPARTTRSIRPYLP